jgi:hypothetical protein
VGVNNIITIADEVEGLIEAFNADLSYFSERDAAKIEFHQPVGRQVGDLRRATTSPPQQDTRAFVVLPGKGFEHFRMDGTESEVVSELLVLVRYYAPPHDWASWRHVHRMAARDAEVICHGVTTHEWAAEHVGEVSSSRTNTFEEIADGLWLMTLYFSVNYQYDGS